MIETVWLDNPPVNAVNSGIIDTLWSAFETLDDGVNAVVLRGRGDRAFVVWAVEPVLGGVCEAGPEPGGVRVPQRDQDAGEQRGGVGEVGGGTLRVGVNRVQRVGENGPGRHEVARRRQRLRLRGQFGERWGHVPHSACSTTLGTSPTPH